MDHRTLRLPRVDNESTFVLAHITPNGSLPLDLKIEATEGESPYIGYLKQGSDKLGHRAKSYHGSAKDWQTVLAYGLAHHEADFTESDTIKGLQVVAQIESSKLTIIFRKNVEGITQRVGTVTLNQDDSLELSIFDWAGQAVSAGSAAQEAILSLRSKYSEQQKTIDKMQAQLDDLVKVKEENEEMLLNKFTQLLNNKKAKIRDQQRLLAAANVDPMAEERPSTGVDHSRKAEESGSKKRRAEAAIDEREHGEDVGDLEDENQRDGRGEDDDMNVATPDKSDLDATEDEEESEGIGHASLNPSSVKRGEGAKGKATEALARKDQEVSEGPEEPPPRRELPFPKPNQQTTETEVDQATKKLLTQIQNNEDSTDDEL